MPTKVYNETNLEVLARLCEDSWNLSAQIEELENWLKDNQDSISNGKYIADVGFSARKKAFGGGAVLTPEAMSIMSKLGMQLFLSEYANVE